MLKGKKILVLGVANKKSIAWAITEALHTQGAELAEKLHAQEEHINQEENEYPNDYFDDQGDNTFVTTYESYYDPFYISPIWFLF